MPISNITKFYDRPKKRDAEDITFSKLILRGENEELLREAKRVEQKQKEYEGLTNWSQRFKKLGEMRKAKNNVKDSFLIHEETVKIVQMEDINNLSKSNPLTYVWALVYGCISLLISFSIVLHTIYSILPKNGNWEESANTF